MSTKRFLAMIAAIIALPGTALPQDRPGVAFRPSRNATSFMLTEFSSKFRVTKSAAEPEPWLMAIDVGWMRNLGSRFALGASAYIEGPGRTRYGFRPRIRTWLGDTSALDVTVAVPLHRADQHRNAIVSLGTALTYRDFIGLDIGVDIMSQEPIPWIFADPTPETQTKVEWLVGLRTGRELGVFSTVIVAVVFLVIYANNPGFTFP